ncbi:ATP-binding domain-containing protein [Streptomyces sp. LX-29]|uniref:helix-hairpin-helix domain-containing protein n=1 Tax=Streptomyces sp. LX-29 TaxID=2900152 RepID=UPI00240D0B25|nr:helix-hairpin-helix domain-containing protein [Streptomyces sp. LX-29]WFB10396.1 ATP-binding domain-containing protein [Streptomyces sp. LX-29]
MSTDRLAGDAATAPEEAPEGVPTREAGVPADHPAGSDTPGDSAADAAGKAPTAAPAGASGEAEPRGETAGTPGSSGAGEVDAEAAGYADADVAGTAHSDAGGESGAPGAEAAPESDDTPSDASTTKPAEDARADASGPARADAAGEPGQPDTETGTETVTGTGAARAEGAGEEARPVAGAPGAAREAERPSTDTGAQAGSGRKRSAAAEALAAAVRAVESGERSAASFFTERASAPAPSATPRAPQARQEAPSGVAAGPVPAAARRDVTAGPARPAVGGVAPGASRPAAALADTAGVREVLAAGGAPAQLAGPVVEALGEQAADALRADPWLLLGVPGMRPEQADGFARALLGSACGPGDARRSQALITWLLERAALEGYTALTATAVREALARQTVPDPEEALRTAIGDGAVLVFQDALETPGGGRPGAAATGRGEGEDGEGDESEPPVRILLGLDRYALAEESLADGLARLINTFEQAVGATDQQDGAAAEPRGDVAARPDWEGAAAAAPSPSAAELIRAVAGHGLVAHSGGEAARAEPAALVGAARALGLRAYAATHSEDGRRRLAAPSAAGPAGSTGAADTRAAGLGEAGGADPEGPDADSGTAAVTVAGLLSGHEGPGRDEEGALALDLLVVLDAPQLDVETAAMLVESLPDGARLVLSGDPGVLWSAGPGRVFADLLAARCCPQVVSRTPDPGPIGELVSGIGIGELNQVEAPHKEVVIVPVRDAGEAVHRTVQLVADSVPRVIGVPAEQVQVITPGHGGAAGTRALNAALKERLNPGPGRFGGFDPGDRVAYVPAPGRMVLATVTSADTQGLHLDCAGAAVVIPREQVAETVRHGWAVTAHQAAGSRWPAVVVVLPGDATAALTRAWVYTAFGRGERHLSVVHGADDALPNAVARIPAKERTTRLRSLLEAQAAPTAD